MSYEKYPTNIEAIDGSWIGILILNFLISWFKNLKGLVFISVFFPPEIIVTVFLLISQILSGFSPIIVYLPLETPFSTDSKIKLFFSANRNL